MIKRFITLSMLVLLSGCGVFDGITYKIPKQQGNITEEADFEKLEIGMSKEQVRFVMGTPMSVNSFNTDRWDYLYTYKPGHGELTKNHLTLYFENNQLVKIDGKPLRKKDINRDAADASETDKKS